MALKTASLVRVERTLAATTPTKPSSPHRPVASALSLQKLRRKPGRMTGNLWPGSLLLAPSLCWKLSLPLIRYRFFSPASVPKHDRRRVVRGGGRDNLNLSSFKLYSLC